MTGQREAQLLETVNTLLDARRTVVPIDELPPALRPATEGEAFWVQDQLIQSFGEIGGWKVGVPTPDAPPICAPMPRAWIASNACILAAPHFRFRGLEAELAFLFGEDLPRRAAPYTVEEIKGAIASAHPAIEILESAFTDPTQVARLSMLADLQMHGGFVFGPACPSWPSLNLEGETTTLAVDGSIRAEHTASSAAGDHFNRLLHWLANDGAARTGGLRAGQFVTTGSWTGVTRAVAGSAVRAHFSTLGQVSLSFR
jgi:2-keto-4-pentenoate hydratase